MTLSQILVYTATLLACVTPVLTQNLPYNPTFLLQGKDSKVYQLSAATTPQFAVYDVAHKIAVSDTPQTIANALPFLTNSTKSFVPVAVNEGLQVFSGICSAGVQEVDLWNYDFAGNNQSWTQMQTISTDSSIRASFLSAAFAFSNSNPSTNDTLYVFGGMCPSINTSQESWTAAATYSNTMLTITAETGDDYQLSLTGQRAPPVAEAGLSITPLNASAVGSAQQQNFVLIGGHTQQAFINMSQLAMFSLPEQAWAFIGITQPSATIVEPRSGHTAVISQDGSKIFVFGGWVGDTKTPADPQLAILHVGQGYGGNGSWAWTVPVQASNPFSTGQGIYGHGAVMLPGGIMMVAGGYPIAKASSQAKRGNTQLMFYNTTSATWITTYTFPQSLAHTESSASDMTPAQMTGLGAGLGLGIPAVIVVIVIGLIYIRRMRQKRTIREKELRAMALGTDHGYSNTKLFRSDHRSTQSANRSASWGARQEESIEASGAQDQWYSPHADRASQQDALSQDEAGVFNRSGAMFNVPTPAEGLRKTLHVRGMPGLGSYPQGSAIAGSVFRIDEEDEERSQRGSIKRLKTSGDFARPLSDPFKDPPVILPSDGAAEQRRQEVRTWVEDWTSAAESMNMSRSNSKAHSRTYSNLSMNNSSSSGDKSDRTGSNLSERSNRSNLSIQRSATGTISRNLSQRSAGAGYALFASASAAMSRMAGRPQDTSQTQLYPQSSALGRTASKRSISTGDLAQLAARKRSNSVEQNSQPVISTSHNNILTSRVDEPIANFWTPAESPIKDYKNKSRERSSSLTSQSKKALGVFSQATKRVLSGTNNVNVASKVSEIENKNGPYSPTKYSGGPEMTEVTPRRACSTGTNTTFWKHKQGAKDWDILDSKPGSSGTMRRRPGRTQFDEDGYHEPSNSQAYDDWDVEQAIQQRVVQVMFTVPKERLRVVNADNLSLMSRSDTNASRYSRRSVEDTVQDENHDAIIPEIIGLYGETQ